MDDIEVVRCGEGDDEVTAGFFGVTVFGGEGDDTLEGGDDNDELFGEGGDDSIVGGFGEDSLFGGVGADFINAVDLVEDFIDGGDDVDVALFDFVDTVINVP